MLMVFSGAIILPLVPAGNIQKADTAGNYIFNAKIPYHDFYAAYRTNTVKDVIDDVDLTSGATYSSKLRTLEFHTTFPVAGIIIFLLAIAGICIAERFFCQFLCPMGALFALLPVVIWQYPYKRKYKCLDRCSLCAKNCPVCIKPGSKEHNGECIRCGKCVSGCPV